MTAAAFEHADLLRRLARAEAEPIASNAALAAELGRDPSNMRKTIKTLADDGVVAWTPGEVPALTDLGRQTLRGIDVAQGVASDGPAPAPTRWPIRMIRPNPGNRSIDPEGIDDLAASIVALGDIIQPLVLTPPDDGGIRMILAGERRWRAVNRIAEDDNQDIIDNADGAALFVGRMPEALRDGLPFVEREATEAEALQLMIIENSQREGVSPLEDARMLLKLQQLTGWTGVELAIQLGRADRENKNGAKDVQDKLKIAREATPEAIAAYEATGSWDDLRNSVRTRREETPVAEAVLPDASQLMLIEIAWAFDNLPVEDGDGDSWVLTDGYAYMSAGFAELVQRKLVDYQVLDLPNARPAVIRPTTTGWDWIVTNVVGVDDITDAVLEERRGALATSDGPAGAYNDEGFRTKTLNAKTHRARLLPASEPLAGPHVVHGVDYHNASRAQEACYALGIEQRPAANSGGGAPAPAASEPKDISRRARMALVELAHKIHAAPQPLDPGTHAAWSGDAEADHAAFGALAGRYWLDAAFAELVAERLVRAVHLAGPVPPMVALTPTGVHWLRLAGVPLPPPEGALRRYQDVAGALTGEPGLYATDWLATEVAPAATPEQPDLIEPTAEEIAARARAQAEAAADAAAVLTIKAFAEQIEAWAVEARADGRADHVSQSKLSLPAGAYESLAMATMSALADGRIAEAGAILAALRHHIGETGSARLFREMPIPMIQTALMDGRIVAEDADDDAAPWAPDPDPSDDPALTDADLELSEGGTAAEPQGDMATRVPAVPIRRSVTPDYIICLEDGRKFKSLKRHLRTRYDLSPEQYIARWGLPKDYPMVAPNYARARAELARQMGARTEGAAA